MPYVIWFGSLLVSVVALIISGLGMFSLVEYHGGIGSLLVTILFLGISILASEKRQAIQREMRMF